jgi:hypothetical protein
MDERLILSKACCTILLCLGLAGIPTRAFAECGPRPVDACELVNNDAEIFVGRILSQGQDALEWRMRVVRSYRGSAKGDVTVEVWSQNDLPSTTDLAIGGEYLFYVSKTVEDGVVKRTTPLACGDWLPLAAVRRDEIAFLAHLKSRTPDGRVFGRLVRRVGILDEDPLPGIQIVLNDGKKSYAGQTDAKGRFNITGLHPGAYRASSSIPREFLIETDDRIEIVPHGCVDAYLLAEMNTTIAGRITLPPGVKVVGTEVSALSVTGRGIKETFADPEGRYVIPGLDPGEYVVGINARGMPPALQAPFPPTYAPGTTDITQATKISISGPAAFSDINISVPVAAQIVTVKVKATFSDGRPVVEQRLRVTRTGYGEQGVGMTASGDGIASVSFVRGVPVYLVGASESSCVSPVRIGPEVYPDLIEVSYTADGCREEFNLTELGMLQASVGGEIGRVPIHVSFPDGTPAYKAQVSILSRSRSAYAAGFQTDANGRLEFPAPVNEEFTIDAGLHEAGVNCRSAELLFNTERGVRVRPFDRNSRPNWDDVAPAVGTIELVLEGPTCRTVPR